MRVNHASLLDAVTRHCEMNERLLMAAEEERCRTVDSARQARRRAATKFRALLLQIEHRDAIIEKHERLLAMRRRKPVQKELVPADATDDGRSVADHKRRQDGAAKRKVSVGKDYVEVHHERSRASPEIAKDATRKKRRPSVEPTVAKSQATRHGLSRQKLQRNAPDATPPGYWELGLPGWLSSSQSSSDGSPAIF